MPKVKKTKKPQEEKLIDVPISKLGKVAEAFRDSVEIVRQAQEARNAAMQDLIDEMKAAKKESYTIEGQVFILTKPDSFEKIKIKKVKSHD